MNHNVAAKQSLHNKTKALTRREKGKRARARARSKILAWIAQITETKGNLTSQHAVSVHG